MNIITLDFETYYSQAFSLSKLTTEEYVRDDQFEVIGVSVKENDGETKWYSGTHNEILGFLSSYDWDNSFVLADRKSTRLNSSHTDISRMPSSA